MVSQTRSNQTQIQDQDSPKEVIRDEEAEIRLQELSARLHDLNVASNLILLKRGRNNSNPMTDICTKVESVRWMLRIAKHLTAPAREILFSTIRKSLEQIERTIEIDVSAAGVSQTYKNAIHV